MKKLFISVLLLLMLLPIFSQEIHFAALSDIREAIFFPELTAEEKVLIAEQARILLSDIYVNRFQKMEYYGADKDPVPRINEVVDKAATLTTEELEMALYNIIVSQRDLHLNYLFPEQYSAFSSFIPLYFDRTASADNAFEVRIAGVNQEFIEMFSPEQRMPELGDEVIAYNGLPIADAVALQEKTSQGANEYGGFRRAIERMTFIPHLLHPIPANNSATVTLKSLSMGDTYTVTYPWITYWFGDIYFQADRVADKNQLFPSAKKVIPAPVPVKLEKRSRIEASNLWQQLLNNFRKEVPFSKKSIYPYNESNEPTIGWGTIERNGELYGYLRLDSFVPQLGDQAAVEEMVRLLTTELADTKGLLIDVRNNGGGSLLYAEMIAQLFIPFGARLSKARLLNTDMNRYLFNETIFGGFFLPTWREAINAAAGSGSKYAEPNAFFLTEGINGIGQAYYKPVVVLNNAASYSATDIFSCIMQDNSFVIFGEDPKTGAGGANVLHQREFAEILGSPFEELPYGHDMRFSFSQLVRFGRSEGKVIEDYGCEAQKDVSLTLEDLLTGGEGQLNTILDYLDYRSAFYKTSVKADNPAPTLYQTADAAGFGVTVSNNNYIAVYINDRFYNKLQVNTGDQRVYVPVQLPATAAPGDVFKVRLYGRGSLSYSNWIMQKTVVIIKEKIAIDDSGFIMDFATATSVDPFTIVNRGNSPEDGWQLREGALQVGYTPNYADNVNTDAIVVADLSNLTTGTFAFSMEMDTEENWDYFTVWAEVGGQRLTAFSASGRLEMATYSFDAAPFAGISDLVLHFQFKSDVIINYPGVKITSITLN